MYRDELEALRTKSSLLEEELRRRDADAEDERRRVATRVQELERRAQKLEALERSIAARESTQLSRAGAGGSHPNAMSPHLVPADSISGFALLVFGLGVGAWLGLGPVAAAIAFGLGRRHPLRHADSTSGKLTRWGLNLGLFQLYLVAAMLAFAVLVALFGLAVELMPDL